MRRRERDGCGTFRFFEVSSRGATAQHTPPRQCREEGRKYSFRRRDTVDAWTRRIANGENFFFEKTPLESKRGRGKKSWGVNGEIIATRA